MRSVWNGLLKSIQPKSVDEDAARREYILNIILVGSIVMAVLCDALVLYYAINRGMDHRSGISFWKFSILPAFFILLYVLSRRNRARLAAYLLVLVYFFGNSYAAYRWGVNVPTMLVGYALLIVITSILISARAAFVITLFTGLIVFPLWYQQLNSMGFRDAEDFTVGDGIALIILYGFITLVAWLSNREIEKALRRARKSEGALKEERDLLEFKVEERTQELRIAEMERIDHLYRFAEFGRMASGLFHDLLNVVNVLALRMEERAEHMPEANMLLDDARSTHEEIERFKQALQRQLSRDDAPQNFSITDATANALQFLDYQAKHEHVSLQFEHDSDDPLDYIGSPLKFHQIIVNLVVNAIEAFETKSGDSHAKRLISIRLQRDDDDILVSVEDNGCGIPTALQVKIYTAFFTTKTARKKGIGIGLAITKRIIEQDFRGTITVMSEEGKGTLFTIRLPNTVYGANKITSRNREEHPGNTEASTS